MGRCSLCRGSPRSTDLKKVADAWQPLYQTLSPEQKRRMGYLAMCVIREMRTNAEERRMQSADDETYYVGSAPSARIKRS